MDCLEKIVTLGACGDDDASISGFRLLDASGISVKKLADITDSDTPSGVQMALNKKKIAINKVKNDFLGALRSNSVMTSPTVIRYETSKFDASVSTGNFTGYRGIVLHKAKKYKGAIRETKILSIQAYPLQSGTTTLRMEISQYNVNTVYSWEVPLVANEVNIFDLSELPFTFPDDADFVRVLIDQSIIPFAACSIPCKAGCNGTLPNDCAWADGWDGNAATKNSGFGINVVFSCECNYDRLLCDLSKTYIGELIYLKWQIEIFEEQYRSGRFTSAVVYDRSDINDNILPQLRQEYNSLWSNLMGGTLNILNSFRDDCLNCRGIRWKTNT